MFGIGPIELVIIAVIALVFVGPKKLPEMMKQLGKFFVHTRRYSTEIRSEFNEVMRQAESEIRMEEAEKMRKQIQEEIRRTSSEITGEISDKQESTNQNDLQGNNDTHEPIHGTETYSPSSASDPTKEFELTDDEKKK